VKSCKTKILTSEEEAETRRMTISRKESFRLVQQAKVIVAILYNAKLHATHAAFKAGFQSRQMEITWSKRLSRRASWSGRYAQVWASPDP
jgi:hypothetical protein